MLRRLSLTRLGAMLTHPVAPLAVLLLTSVSSPSPAPVKATLFVAMNGSDEGVCKIAQPCASLARAYSVARPGAVVEIEAGDYGEQELTAANSRTGKNVVFRPAAGANVTLQGVLFDKASRVELRNVQVGDWYMRYSSHVVIRNVTAHFFFVRVSDNVQILGGSVGPSEDSKSPTIGGYPGEAPSTNITVDGVFFHDIGRQNSPGGHVECLFVQESIGVTIRNSKFHNCDVMDLYVNPIAGGQVSNLTIENNWFDQPAPSGFYGIDMSPQPNTTIAYNSFNASFRLSEGTWQNALVVGNVGWLNNCDSTGIVWSHNVWANRKCPGSTKDIVAPSGFRDPANFDLRLKTKAAAINRGDPRHYPKRDIAGHRRPKGPRPDAGAYETR